MAIQALALLGFDAYLTGQWDSIAEMTDEGVSLCDTHSYGLLALAARGRCRRCSLRHAATPRTRTRSRTR